MIQEFEKVQQLISEIEKKILENSLEQEFLLQTLHKIFKEIEDFDDVDREQLDEAELEILKLIQEEWDVESGSASNADDEGQQPINNHQVNRAHIALHGVLFWSGVVFGSAGSLLFLRRPIHFWTTNLAGAAVGTLTLNAASALKDAIASYTTSRDSTDN